MADEKIYLSAPHLTGEENFYINQAFESNWVGTLGPNVEAFEREIKAYCGSPAAVATNNGTAAIHLALRLIPIKSGDRVFCSSFSFVASANPILYERAIPVFIDSDLETWNMSPVALQRALEEGKKKNRLPKAVIVVDVLGHGANYDKILNLCHEYEIPLIEDAAEALGASFKNKKCGTFGDFGIFSFNGNKIITSSSGGMLLLKNPALKARALKMITQARDPALHYQHSELGFNYRMSNILAGIGLAQLKVIDDRVKKRREIFNQYYEQLKDVPGSIFMPEAPEHYSNRWLTSLYFDPSLSNISLLKLINFLREKNIEARPLWKPLHLQPLFKDIEFYVHNRYFDCDSISEFLFKYGISLPSSSYLNPQIIAHISNCVKQFLGYTGGSIMSRHLQSENLSR